MGVAEHLGSDTFLHVHAEGLGTLTVRAGGDVDLKHGERVFMTPDPAHVHRFDANGKAIAA